MCQAFTGTSGCSNCGDTGYRRQKKHSRLHRTQGETPDNTTVADDKELDSGSGTRVYNGYRQPGLLDDSLPSMGERQ